MMEQFYAWQDWLVRANNPTIAQVWRDQPPYLLANILYVGMAGMALKFAVKQGWNSRYVYMWFAALLHGIVTEVVVYHLPDVNNFWHSQMPLIFVGQRFPLYIVLFYPATITHAFMAAEKLQLPYWAEPFAVGLFDVLLDFPYDIMGIKLLWWTWHDTDPNLEDRHYWVPWTSYFFHLSFHSSFAMLLSGSRYLLTGSADKSVAHGSFSREVLCVVITASLSMVVAVLTQILPIYHGLKDGFEIHSEVIMFIVFGLYFAIVHWSDRTPTKEARSRKKVTWSEWFGNESSLVVTVYYLFYFILVLVARPELQRSTGLHEPIGPSSVKVEQLATSGVIYTKQKFLDPTDFDEGYFDFRCFEGGFPNVTADPGLVGTHWYTLCGTPYESHAEYIVVVWSFCALGFYAFYNALARSSATGGRVSTGRRKQKTT